MQHAVETGDFDEIVISTLPARVSHWLRRDLPRRVEGSAYQSRWSPPTSPNETAPALAEVRGVRVTEVARAYLT